MSRDLTCNSEDGDAAVIALRKLGHDFPAEVSWSTRDGDALIGQHYESEGGKIQQTIAIWGMNLLRIHQLQESLSSNLEKQNEQSESLWSMIQQEKHVISTSY